jgi:hypothetical protein
MTPSRFDYVQYNPQSKRLQAQFKERFTELAFAIEALESPRPVVLALTTLEEAYMWVGKAIRDQQIIDGNETVLEEERSDS